MLRKPNLEFPKRPCTCLSPHLQTKLHSSAPRGSDAEETIETLEDDNRSLKSQLEESRRAASRLAKERDELSRRLEERDLEREALRRGKTDLEEQKRLLDRALEKMTKEVTESVLTESVLASFFFGLADAQEVPSSAWPPLFQMEAMMGESRQSVVVLQTQLDDYRERSRKDLLEAQRTNKERLAELQRVQSNLKAQQEEVSGGQTGKVDEGEHWKAITDCLVIFFVEGFPSEEGAAGVQRGPGQRSAGERPPQQPLQALGE